MTRTRRQGTRFILIAASLGTVLLTSACLAPSDVLGSPTPTSTAAPTVSPTTAPTASASSTPTPTSDEITWDTYSTSDGAASFELPSDWSFSEGSNPDLEKIGSSGIQLWAGPGEPGDSVGVWLNYGPGLGGQGGACETPIPYEVLDSAEMDLPVNESLQAAAPQFVYRILSGDQVYPSMGINNIESGPDGTACYLVTAVRGPEALGDYNFGDAGTSTTDWQDIGHLPPFASRDEAVAFMDTDEYKTLKRIITSLKF